MFGDEPIEVPITDELDLHTFRPSELRDVLDAYIEACLEKDISEVRIIHGKGTGTLRTSVHKILEKHPNVVSFRMADHSGGGWGATRAVLQEI